MKRIFITGATGFLGSSLIKTLAKADKVEIIALVRSSSKTELIDKLGIKKVIGDVRDFNSFAQAVKGCDIIYHLAGVVTDWASKKLYEDVHIKGTQNVLEAAHQAGVKRFVHVSTIDVVAKRGYDKVITDEHPHCLSRIPYISTKIAAEKLCFKYYHEKKLPLCVVRPAWIYGPGDKTLIPEIAYQVKKGSMVFIGSGTNYIPLVYMDNLVNALILASENSKSIGHTFLVSDKQLITWQTLTAIVAEAIGVRRGRFITIPYSAAYLAAIFFELVGRLIKQKKRPLLTRTAVDMLGKSILLDSKKLFALLDYKQNISTYVGLAETVKWLKSVDLNDIRVK